MSKNVPVPKQPTEAMLLAMHNVMFEPVPTYGEIPTGNFRKLFDLYNAMLSASETDELPIDKLICEVGAENIQIQFLSTAVSNVTRPKKGPTKVTFLTDAIQPHWLLPILSGRRPDKTGIILWMDTNLLPNSIS